MRLHGIYDGQLYATDYRSVLLERSDGGFESVGRLPTPPAMHERVRYHLVTSRDWKPLIERVVGAFPSVTLHRFTDDDLLATAGTWLFTSHDGGKHWQFRRRLPRSSGPMGVLPTGVCYHEGAVLLGEYLLGAGGEPRILRSDDLGRSWSTELVLEDVRHIHAIQVDPYTNDLWVTTGDADGECRIGRIDDGQLDMVGGGSQQWRAVQLAFTESAILWGVDCVYTQSNPIYKLDRDALKDERPIPTPVFKLVDSVFYTATIPADGEQWVVFSTAAEAGFDSTAPAAGTGGTETVTVVASSSRSAFTEWFELARYAKRRCATDRVNPGGRFPVASAYAYLTADPERGLFVNPYNTTKEGGHIVRFPPSTFSRLGRYK